MEEKPKRKKLLSPNEVAKLKMSKAPGNVMETIRPAPKTISDADLDRITKNAAEYRDYVKAYIRIKLALM